jgi:very-short-patch-repair endonuclease
VIEHLLRRHDGVITAEQARLAGLSQDAVERRIRSGAWSRCSKGVYFAEDRPFTDAARIRAAVWGYGPRAVASGLAAAWWHGLVQEPPSSVEVTVPLTKSGRLGEGCYARRRNLESVDVVIRRNLFLTAIPLTVLESAIRPGCARIMDSALQRRVGLAQLQRAHERNARRHGANAAAQLLRAAGDGSRSDAERLLIRLLRNDGISGWKANHPVAGFLVDIAFPRKRVAIEVDGWAFHSDHDTFQRDRKRQNAIALNNWQILRFTWLDLTMHPERVIAEIKRAIGP